MMKTALTIAGSDSSGGAGIQADIKTMTALGVYGMSVITALTAQNTLGVRSILTVDGKFLADQFDSVFTDIYPDAVKIGMLSGKDIIEVTYNKLKEYKATNIVLDPVMVSTSGSRLIDEDAIELLIEKLMPLATIVTPNIPEAEILSGMKINTMEDMEIAGKKIRVKAGCAVLMKGGHSLNDANDLLVADECVWFHGERIDNDNTHGTGCTLSSAIASNLAKGYSLKDSIKRAKKYISGALKTGLNLGKGSGPLNHAFNIKEETVYED